MDDLQSRSWLRERILIDLRNIVKQVYHESVNNELSFENKTYICITLIKNLDEALLHGLKHLHLGYWKPVCKILHHHTLQLIEKLPVYNGSECNPLMKGRAWIAISLKDDSFISYIQCLVSEVPLEKFYEDWSILRTSDALNYFLSILSGLDSVLFSFQIDYINRLPNACNFGVKAVTNDGNKTMTLKLNDSKSSIDLTTSTTSLTSPVDSGVHIQDSTSDVEQLLHDKEIDEIDFLNGNVPEGVLLRKNKKEKKRHVSFHEDIMYKSPEKCRKLKWDSENLRYSWSGEQIDSSILKEVDFNEIKIQGQKSSTPIKVLDISERGTPEGQETPCPKEQPKQNNNTSNTSNNNNNSNNSNNSNNNNNNKSQKSVIVRRFLQSIKKQSKIRNLTKKYNYVNDTFKKYPVDLNLVAEINNAIKSELESKPKPLISKHEVDVNISLVKEMIRNQSIYKAYKLRDFLFIITNANIYLIKKNLGMKRISFKHINKVVVYPDLHFFLIEEAEEGFHMFVTGEEELTNDLIGKIEFSMRRNQFDPPQVYMLDYEDLFFFKKTLIDKIAIGKKENLIYCGAIYLDKETDLMNSILPTSKRGFLMYRNVQSADGWIPGDFCLKNGMLYLFEEESKFPKLAINIATACQSCYRTTNPDRPHTFQISLIEKEIDFHSDSSQQNNFFKSNMLKSNSHNLFSGLKKKVNKLWSLGRAKENGCVLELAAANECELCEWLQMIIQASCGDHCEEANKESAIEGTLWLTSNSLVVTSMPSSVQSELEIISCAQLQDVAAFRIGESEKDFFTVIEFACMEATASSGDWILYTSSREELIKLQATLQSLWTSNNKFPCETMKAGKLVTQLRKSQDRLSENYWSQLLK